MEWFFIAPPEVVRKHKGPGKHSSGSAQQVHAGREGGAKSKTSEERAAVHGAAEYKKGNPGVVMAVTGEFDFARSLKRHLGEWTSPREVGLQRFTGKRNLVEAKAKARRAINILAAEVGARRAAGKKTPSMKKLRQQVLEAFGLKSL